MKPRKLYRVFIFISALMVLLAAPWSREAESHTSGAPAGKTGSPGDNSTCTSCHSGPAASTMPGWITSTIPVDGYTPGNTYTISATATRPGHSKFGFEVSPQNLTGSLRGTMILTNTTATKLISSGKYITHTSSGTSGSGTRTWSFDWTAPAAGTGALTFYGAFNASNSGNNSGGDSIFLSTLAVTECASPAQPGVISGNTQVCFGAVVSYSVSAVPAATGYNWTLPSGWTGTSTSTSITATVGNSSGTISVTALNSCGMSTPRLLPVAVSQITVTATATPVTCSGTVTGTATAFATNGIPNYSYSWSPSGGTNATATGLGAGIYTVTVTDAAGCADNASVVISEPPLLVASAGDDASVCSGESLLIGSPPVATGGMTPYNYLWSPAAGLSSPTDSTPLASPAGTTSYQLTVTDANGCSATSVTTVSVYPVLQVPVITMNDDTLFSTPAAYYQWYLDGSPVSGATLQSYLPQQDGNYTVVVTDGNGCSTTSDPFVITRMNELNHDPDFLLNVFPNPFEDEAVLRYVISTPTHVSISLVAMAGDVSTVIVDQYMQKGIYEMKLNADKNLLPGIYLLRFISDEQQLQQKILIR